MGGFCFSILILVGLGWAGLAGWVGKVMGGFCFLLFNFDSGGFGLGWAGRASWVG